MAAWNRNNTRALVIAGLAVLALPATRKALRPILVAGAQGVMTLGDMIRNLSSGAQETMEDIVAEAHFKRLQRMAADDIADAAVGAGAGASLGAAVSDGDGTGMESTTDGNTPGTLRM